MDDETMVDTDDAMTLLRATDADPRGTVLMLLRVLGGGLATATDERDEARAEVERLRAALEEREHDMHLRIRAGYDRTIADSWRAEVERAVAAEREACAMIATPYAARWPCAGDIVAKIRARGAGGGV